VLIVLLIFSVIYLALYNYYMPYYDRSIKILYYSMILCLIMIMSSLIVI